MDEMFDYLERLNDDLIQQFKNQPNAQVLMKAFARQLQDVYIFFCQLHFERHIDRAIGKQLDGIGDIVCLTRYEASLLSDYYYGTSDMDDETYRKYLKYKILLNTNTCTYPDIMKALKVFWDTSPIIYSETPERPATIIIETPPLKPEANAGAFLQIPTVKAAGVTLIMKANTRHDEKNITTKTVIIGAKKSQTTLAEAARREQFVTVARIGGVYTRKSSTTLTESVAYVPLIDASGATVLDASGAVIEVRT